MGGWLSCDTVHSCDKRRFVLLAPFGGSCPGPVSFICLFTASINCEWTSEPEQMLALVFVLSRKVGACSQRTGECGGKRRQPRCYRSSYRAGTPKEVIVCLACTITLILGGVSLKNLGVG